MTLAKQVEELQARCEELDYLCGMVLATILLEGNRNRMDKEFRKIALSWWPKYVELSKREPVRVREHDGKPL